MTILLLVLAVLLVGGTALLVSGRTPLAKVLPGVGNSVAAESMAPPVASLPPVLLPESPTARDVDAVRFGLGLRGYRMDQVDQVLDRLAEALSERDAVIDDLHRRLGTAAAPTPSAP